MNPFEDIGKTLLFLGFVLSLLGLLLILVNKIPFPFGRLPGDIIIKKGNFTFYFPLVTCIIISIILTLIFSFFSKR